MTSAERLILKGRAAEARQKLSKLRVAVSGFVSFLRIKLDPAAPIGTLDTAAILSAAESLNEKQAEYNETADALRRMEEELE